MIGVCTIIANVVEIIAEGGTAKGGADFYYL